MQAPQRIARLTPVADVLDRIAALVTPVGPAQANGHRSGRTGARGRCGRPSRSPGHGDCAARRLRGFVRGHRRCGRLCAGAAAGAAGRVDAGDPLPPGTDAVASPDAVVAHDGRHEIQAQVAPGEGVLLPHGDVAPATVLLTRWRAAARRRSGGVVGGRDRARTGPRAARSPRARRGAAADTVLDAAARWSRARLNRGGAELVQAAEATRDDLASGPWSRRSRRDRRRSAAPAAAADRSVQSLARAGRVEAHGIAITPGETAAFGVVGSRPVLLLPGRIDAALAVWLLLGRRMLARLSGRHRHEPATSRPG